MAVIPENFCYTHIYEYLVKRTITILTKSKESDSEEADLEFELPIAEKPLMAFNVITFMALVMLKK